MMENFKHDLEIGHKAEDKVKHMFEKAGYKVTTNDSVKYNVLKAYDLLVNDNVKVEVKHDLLAPRTGNVAIEVECNYQPSGLMSTEATLWVYLIDNTFYIYKTDVLKDLVNRKLYHRAVKGGDGNRSKMYLFKFSVFKNNANKIILKD